MSKHKLLSVDYTNFFDAPQNSKNIDRELTKLILPPLLPRVLKRKGENETTQETTNGRKKQRKEHNENVEGTKGMVQDKGVEAQIRRAERERVSEKVTQKTVLGDVEKEKEKVSSESSEDIKSEMKKKLIDQRTEIKANKVELKKMEKRIQELEQLNSDLEKKATMKNNSEKMNQLEKENRKLGSSVTSLEEENKSLKEKVKNLSMTTISENEKLLKEKEQLLKEIKKLKKEQKGSNNTNYKQESEKTQLKIIDLTKKCEKYKKKLHQAEEEKKASLDTLFGSVLTVEKLVDNTVNLCCRNLNIKNRVLKFELTPVTDNDQKEMVQYTPIKISLDPPVPEFIREEIFVHKTDIAILLCKIVTEVTKNDD